MKIIIKRELLLENLNKVSKALSTKNLVPALAGIKFDLKKEGLTLTASDNDITIESFIPKNDDMQIEETGSIIIQGRYILDIVRKIPDTVVNLEVFDETKIIISTENSEYNLNGINKRDYPNINLEESKNPIKIESKELINQTAFAAGQDESRPQLTGINFKILKDELECNSTDSYRLARKVLKLKEETTDNYNIIIPSRNLMEFVKIIDDDEHQRDRDHDISRLHITQNGKYCPDRNDEIVKQEHIERTYYTSHPSVSLCISSRSSSSDITGMPSSLAFLFLPDVEATSLLIRA